MSYTTIYITQTLLYLTNGTMYFKSSTINLQEATCFGQIAGINSALEVILF